MIMFAVVDGVHMIGPFNHRTLSRLIYIEDIVNTHICHTYAFSLVINIQSRFRQLAIERGDPREYFC